MRKKNKREFNLKEEYKKSWKYLKRSRNFIYIIIGLFFVFCLVGFFIPASSSLSEQILKFIYELIEKTKDMSQGELIGFIFFNNLQSSFYGMIFGVFLGVFPIIAAIVNGYLLGFVSSMSVENLGGGVLLKLIPHGIFELPAVIFSIGIGMKIGVEVVSSVWLVVSSGKGKCKKLKYNFI